MDGFDLVAAGAPRAVCAIGGAVLGAIFGSWIATAVLRWPLGRSTARGRSACDACAAPLNPAMLVPVLSWVALRGRCARCGARIDPLHPLAELAAAGIGGAALWLVPGFAGLAGAGFGWALLLLAMLDARHLWLPDRVTLPLLAAGLAVGALGAAPSLAERAWGAGAGWAVLGCLRLAYRVLRRREGMGGGDPKLVAAIGAWLGWQALPPILLLASVGGIAVAALRRARGARIDGATTLPLGTLLAGAAAMMWAMAQVLAWP